MKRIGTQNSQARTQVHTLVQKGIRASRLGFVEESQVIADTFRGVEDLLHDSPEDPGLDTVKQTMAKATAGLKREGANPLLVKTYTLYALASMGAASGLPASVSALGGTPGLKTLSAQIAASKSRHHDTLDVALDLKWQPGQHVGETPSYPKDHKKHAEWQVGQVMEAHIAGQHQVAADVMRTSYDELGSDFVGTARANDELASTFSEDFSQNGWGLLDNKVALAIGAFRDGGGGQRIAFLYEGEGRKKSVEKGELSGFVDYDKGALFKLKGSDKAYSLNLLRDGQVALRTVSGRPA